MRGFFILWCHERTVLNQEIKVIADIQLIKDMFISDQVTAVAWRNPRRYED